MMSRNYNETGDNDRIIRKNSVNFENSLYTEKIKKVPIPSKEVSEVSEKNDSRLSSIEQGLDFMLDHFVDNQEALWPRNISTAVIEGRQRPVGYRDLAISYYSGSFNRDSRLACYPNYDKLIENGDLPLPTNPGRLTYS